MLFANREEAGILLAAKLKQLKLRSPLIFALPRGGVPVAEGVADHLKAPLEVLVVRKVGAPGHKEFGIGAVTEGNCQWLDPALIKHFEASRDLIDQTLRSEQQELERRIQHYRGGRPLPPVEGRTVVVVDDGLATGVSARAACAFLRKAGAARIVLAAPVCSSGAAAALQDEADEIVCLQQPEPFFSVGQFYDDFHQTTDQEVMTILERTRNEAA